MHFSALTPTITIEAAFEGMDHLAVEFELLTIFDAENYLCDISVSLEPSINTLYGV